MGTRAFISYQQFCTSGIYITQDGYPDGIEQQLRRDGGRGEDRSLVALIQSAGRCGNGFGGRVCTGEHTLEAFHAIGWGMNPEWHYYMGADGKPRATYVYQGARIPFGEDHTFAGWKYSVWPRYRQAWADERAQEAAQAQAEFDAEAARAQAEFDAMVIVQYREQHGDEGEGYYHHNPRYGGNAAACGLPYSYAVMGKGAGAAAGLTTLCPRCVTARDAEVEAKRTADRAAMDRRAAAVAALRTKEVS